ncbi:MAG: beta-lactamase family protein [Hyphomonadaceae bacterium]|nr:beta-lactamase family protein [Hyphomonadaceae bacterium]
MSTVDPTELGMNAERLSAIPDYFQARYLDSGKLPCMTTMVARGGEVVHEAYRGTTHLGGEGEAVGPETIFRIYSMTKPITSLAAMMLMEQGDLRLDQPLSRYIPEFAETEVWAGGDLNNYETKKPEREIEIRDLFVHTAGLTYGFLFQHEVDALYRREKIAEPFESLGDMCARLAKLPLVFSPGTRWNYGHSTDVLGRVVEVVSGQELDAFFADHIFGPLGMADTGFYVPEDKLHRLTACYQRNPLNGEVTLSDGAAGDSKAYKSRPKLLNGGGGLVSTSRDYLRFCQCLLNGGRLDGARLISPKTWEFMDRNHLPGGATIKSMGDKTFSEARMDGNGFGLGGSVTVDVAETMQPGSVGSFSWGGLANTFFWIDPMEELIAIQMTQMIPSGCYPVRPQFRALVYAALDE